MKIRLLLGDQLNSKHPWFDLVDPEVLYVQMELRQETDYAPTSHSKIDWFFWSNAELSPRVRAKRTSCTLQDT